MIYGLGPQTAQYVNSALLQAETAKHESHNACISFGFAPLIGSCLWCFRTFRLTFLGTFHMLRLHYLFRTHSFALPWAKIGLAEADLSLPSPSLPILFERDMRPM